MLAGIQHVKHIVGESLHHNLNKRTMIINMSFGTPIHSVAMALSIEGLSDLSILTVASAGNMGSYACNHYPAGLRHVLAVAASTHNDTLAPYSNHGYCVRLVAPGHRITGLWNRQDYDYTTLSGTSAAAAHVSGVAALVLSKFPEINEKFLYDTLIDLSVKDVLKGLEAKPRTPNRLLNMAGLLELDTTNE